MMACHDGVNTLTYDAEGRLATSYSPIFGVTSSYFYDAGGQRVSKIFGSYETDYVHDPGGALLTTYVNGSYFGNFQDMWVNGMHFGEVVMAAGNASQTQNFSLTDWLGSQAAYTDPATGVPNAAYVSQPFGDAQTTLFGSNNDDIHFTGKERDGETGNDYFGARYYPSGIGRFLSPDPFIPFNLKENRFQAWISNPQHWNKYVYGLDNPLKFTDPTGMTETIYYYFSSDLTEAQRDFLKNQLVEIEGAIADKLHKAGIKDVVFKDGSQLTPSQISHMDWDNTKGVARLNFANKSFAGWSGANGGTTNRLSVVLMGNFDSSARPLLTSELINALANVGTHELGHGMGFYSHTCSGCSIFQVPADEIYNLFNHDLMNENQGNRGIYNPKDFDMTIPQNRNAVDEINREPEYKPW